MVRIAANPPSSTCLYESGWVAHGSGVIGNIPDDDRPRADIDVVADDDGADDECSSTNGHVIAQTRRAVHGGANGDTGKDGQVFAGNRIRVDHGGPKVKDGQPRSNLGARVEFEAAEQSNEGIEENVIQVEDTRP